MKKLLKVMLVLCVVLGNRVAWAGKCSSKKIAHVYDRLNYISLCPLCFCKLKQPGSMKGHACRPEKKPCSRCKSIRRTIQGRADCFCYCSTPASWDFCKTKTTQAQEMTQYTQSVDRSLMLAVSCDKILNNDSDKEFEDISTSPLFCEPYEWGE